MNIRHRISDSFFSILLLLAITIGVFVALHAFLGNSSLTATVNQNVQPSPTPTSLATDTFLVEGPTAVSNEEANVLDFRSLPGKVLGQGENKEPIGPLGLTTYRIEELTLPKTLTIEINGSQIQVDKAWRLTIFGDGFWVGAQTWHIWIDTIPLSAMESVDISAISAIVFDPSVLQEGAALSVTYGEAPLDSSIRSQFELLEKLSLITLQ